MKLKNFIKTALMFGLPYGLFEAFTTVFDKGGWNEAIFNGLFSTIGFGLLMSTIFYLHKTSRKNTVKYHPPQLAAGEEVLFSDAAAYTLNKKSVTGWLFLTTENLIFSEIKQGAVKQTLYFPLKEVFNVKPAMDSVIFPTGLRVYTQHRLEKFAVDDRHGWSRQIEQATKLQLKQKN